jgi:capsular exopolysaccharide synthesis family protein
MPYIRAVYKHRWVALTAFCVVLGYSAVRSFTTVPLYQARAQLLVESTNPNVVNFKEVVQQDNYNYDYYPTQYAILKSRALARRTIDALKLWEHPEFGGGRTATPSFSIMGTIGGILSWARKQFAADAEQAQAPARTPTTGETFRQSAVIDAFLGRLTIAPVRNSRLVDVKFTSPNAEMAANAANMLAQQYIEQDLEYRFLSTKEASDWLAQQLTQERKKLEESELALQRYREKGDAVALEESQNIVVQRLTELNAAYTKARTERIEKEALYTQLRSLQGDQTTLDTFPAVLANPFVQQLKAELSDLQRQRAQMADRLGEKHPEMIKVQSAIQSTEAKLQAELGKVVQSVRNEFLSAQAQERSLASALESQKADALSLNRKGIEYGVLRREAESNKQIYEALTQRAKETGISGDLKTSNIRIVDLAEVPRGPISPNHRRDLTVGLVAALVAGIGLAFFVGTFDNRINNPDEIKHTLGLSFLGLIPALSGKELGGGKVPLLTQTVPQNFAEAFRGLRTNVMFSSADEGPRTILVTSTQPYEGKTVVAANLAVSLAQTGHKVLLMDADMRKPRQQELFGVSQTPGLSSLLVGKARANDSVRKTSVRNLWLMPAGPNPPNPAELLGSTRFRELLKALRVHFDWIVIDSPPVMAVTDASVIAHRTTGVVFTIGCEQVNRNAAKVAVEQLLSSKAAILGAVLNRVNVRKNPYYYAHYYKQDYAGYYSSDQQDS